VGGSDEINGGLRHQMSVLQLAFVVEHRSRETERRRAGHWEREAVFRASSLAGGLTSQVLAAHRLADAVERGMQDGGVFGSEVSEALCFFREVEQTRASRSAAPDF
jgi:hypothetical protein